MYSNCIEIFISPNFLWRQIHKNVRFYCLPLTEYKTIRKQIKYFNYIYWYYDDVYILLIIFKKN